MMDNFLTWIVQLLFRDQRGEVGDDDSADDTSDKDDKGDQTNVDTEDEKEEEDDELTIDLDEKEEEEDEETKKKAKETKAKDSEEVENLRSEVETLKEKEKEWKRREYQTRKDKERTKVDTDKEKPLTDAQLTKLLEDANTEGDTSIQLNVLKYLAQQAGKGEAKELVNAAEMNRRADGFNKKLEEKFPDIADPNSDMKIDIERTKKQLNIADHPYGDMFAVGFKLFEDMDALIEASYEAGKEEALKGTADEKRKKEIKAKSLPSSKKSPYKKTHGLSASQLETAQQMGLTPDQLPGYAKLVGRKPRTVSVEA